MTDLSDYGSAARALGSRAARKVTPGANNLLHRVYARRADGTTDEAIALQYHATDVITWDPDGTVDLIAWDSVTTRKRFADFLCGVSVSTESGYQVLRYRGTSYGIGGSGRVTLHPDGTVSGDVITADAHADRLRAHRRDTARAARQRRRDAAARDHAYRVIDAARAVFGYPFAGDVARRVADADAYARSVRAAEYRRLRAPDVDYAGRVCGTRTAARAWRDARSELPGPYYADTYTRARDHAAKVAAAARAVFGSPFASTVRARRARAEAVYRAACAHRRAVDRWARDARERADAVRAVFGLPFASTVAATAGARWVRAHGLRVAPDGTVWLHKNVRRDERGRRVSAHRPYAGTETYWPIGGTVVPDRWDPRDGCGGGLHASATFADASRYVAPSDPGCALRVRVRVADIVPIGPGPDGSSDKCKVRRVLSVRVAR